MNLVKQIMDQLSGGGLSQLSSLLDTDVETTERAATAVVPSLLSVLGGMASNDDGARKLSNALGGLDTSGLGNFAQMLGGNASSLLGKGTTLLGSLLGDGAVSSLASTLSRITGLSAGTIKSLLAYLMPLILGKVAAQWRNQGGTSHALKTLFAEQRDNIANAVPAGFSLPDMPGMSEVRKAAYNTPRKAEAETVAATSPARWIWPVALALLAGLVLWQFLSRSRDNQVVQRPNDRATERATDPVRTMKPVLPDTIDVPNLTGVRDELSGLFKSLNTAFTDIRDAASAERAMPALKELSTKIDSMDQVFSRLPRESRTTLRPALEEHVKVVTEKANAASSIQGISSDLKALIQEIVAKITKWISADNR